MLIFLSGSDDYRRLQKKNQIIAEFKKKRSDFGLDFFDCEEADSLPRLREFLKTQSIFETAKLAVLENAFEADPKKLAEILEPELNSKGIQILLSEKGKPVKALAFLLEKPVLSQKLENLAGEEWMDFIKSLAKENGVTLTSSAAQFLGTIYEGNSLGLVTELKKLSALSSSIDKKDLDVFDLEAAPNYWALFSGLKSYDIKNRMYALEKLFSINDPAPKIFNILAGQMSEKIPHMAEYDLAVKSGKIDYEEALLDLAIS